MSPSAMSGSKQDVNGSERVVYSIGKASPKLTVSIEGWTYGEAAKAPAVGGNTEDGDVTYEYKVKDAEDSAYSRDVPTDAGDYTVRASVAETESYQAGTATADFTIARRALTVTAASANKVYDGKPLVNGEVAVGGDGFAVGEGATYNVTGSQTDVGSSANAFTYALNGNTKAGNYDITATPGTLTVAINAFKADISAAKVTLAETSYAYDGTAKEPAVESVVLGGKTLKAGVDYSVSYADNVELGTATVTVTGVSNYAGSAKATFAITLAKTQLSTAGNVPKSSVTASWKKVAGAKKYQLQYRKAGGKWKTAAAKGVSKTVKKLKAGKLYQFRVRAVAGKHKGAWSDVSRRYLQRVKGLKATVKKAGSVTVSWKAVPKANAGYTVLVRYAKGGAVVAQKNVAKGKTKATVKGLQKGERCRVDVIPLRKSGGKTYEGVTRGVWAKDKTKSSGLTAASN